MEGSVKLPERGPICIPDSGTYDASGLAAFERCPFFFYNRYILKRVPIGESAAALVFGSAIHEGIAWLLLHEWDLEGAISKFLNYPDVMTASDEKRGPEKGEAALKSYRDRWAGSLEYAVLESQGEKVVEQAFVLPISLESQDEPDFGGVFAGRLDTVVKWHGGVYVMDHKTTSSMWYATRGMRPNLQFDGYAWACREQFGQCDGVIGDFIDLGKKDRIEFNRVPSPRSAFEMDSFEIQFLNHLKLLELCIAEEVWPTFRTHCFDYNRECEYANLCMHNVDVGLEIREE